MGVYARSGGTGRPLPRRGYRRAGAAVAACCLLLAGCAERLPGWRPGATGPEAGDAVRVWTERVTLPTRDVSLEPASQLTPRMWTLLCLENEYLVAKVIPEAGGRVYGLFDKLANRDVVDRPALIGPVSAICERTSIGGGTEANGPVCYAGRLYGESHWTIRQYPDGSASVLVGDIERISQVSWTVEWRLCPGRACLDGKVRLRNRSPFCQHCGWSEALAQGLLAVGRSVGDGPAGALDRAGKERPARRFDHPASLAGEAPRTLLPYECSSFSQRLILVRGMGPCSQVLGQRATGPRKPVADRAAKRQPWEQTYDQAVTRLEAGDLEAAYQLLLDVQRLASKQPEAHAWVRAANILRGRVLLSAGRFREAQDTLLRQLRAQPDDSYVAALAAYAAAQDKGVEAARRVVRKYLADPDLDPMARLEMELATGEADETLQRMLLRDPRVAIDLACDYIDISDWTTAKAILAGAYGEVATSAMTWLMAGWCAEVLGKDDEAAQLRARAAGEQDQCVAPGRPQERAAIEAGLRAAAKSSRTVRECK